MKRVLSLVLVFVFFLPSAALAALQIKPKPPYDKLVSLGTAYGWFSDNDHPFVDFSESPCSASTLVVHFAASGYSVTSTEGTFVFDSGLDPEESDPLLSDAHVIADFADFVDHMYGNLYGLSCSFLDISCSTNCIRLDSRVTYNADDFTWIVR